MLLFYLSAGKIYIIDVSFLKLFRYLLVSEKGACILLILNAKVCNA